MNEYMNLCLEVELSDNCIQLKLPTLLVLLDHVIRVVEMRTASATYKQPVSRLSLLNTNNYTHMFSFFSNSQNLFVFYLSTNSVKSVKRYVTYFISMYVILYKYSYNVITCVYILQYCYMTVVIHYYLVKNIKK